MFNEGEKIKPLVIIILALALLSLAPLPAMGVNPDAILGVWNTEDNDAHFEIYRCGAHYCGRIVSMDEPAYPSTDATMPGLPRVDRKNPDSELRRRPLLGLTLMSGFRQESGNLWKGRIYNPEDGNTYRCNISLADSDRLKIRGYLGVPLLGKTEVWTRVRSAPQS